MRGLFNGLITNGLVPADLIPEIPETNDSGVIAELWLPEEPGPWYHLGYVGAQDFTDDAVLGDTP